MSTPLPPLPEAWRYALYLLPPEPWYTLGTRWLGRCACTGTPIDGSPRQRLAHAARIDLPTLDRWTEAPRLYGLHATFKPPFRLAAGQTAAALDAELQRFAAQQGTFTIEPVIEPLRGFLAWRLRHGDPARDALHRLADACVREFDAFRLTAPAAELARRRQAGLSDAQERHLQCWGYPYVFDTFTFHITLTGRLGHTELVASQRALETAGTVLPRAMPVDHVALFTQPSPDAPFTVARIYRFDGRVDTIAQTATAED
ncbi:DUF1045 domain-containing protein [Ralstonia solanacearum]|uniref:DUF1045 domain-containing protein n=1 Tax=Ralstonia solanacearum TaxID=305 RepID=UPI0005AC9719|nr:DUF1045 domain-containing protein [Ralstonia solanacearum]MDB0565390.1 DUF1045 domain-containing protein [Ralstonia solanacearum]MDB0574577.1 DUF1045 domain-containing protein [Ralstonia solanacearum]